MGSALPVCKYSSTVPTDGSTCCSPDNVWLMTDSRFNQRLNQQIAYEFGASQQYIAIAVYFDSETLPQLAGRFYQQALEERSHAMMLIQYLIDTDAPVHIPSVEEPQNEFAGASEPVRLALAQEKRVSEQIAELSKLAREEGDYQGEQFMQWFLKEQVEEVSWTSDLLRVLERAGDNLLLVEEFLAREEADEAADPTAPPAAGGVL